MKHFRTYSILIISIFMIMLTLPLIKSLVTPDKTISLVEKRPLAEFPSIPRTLEDLNSYPQKFELYYQDHFGFRDELVWLRNFLTLESPDNVLRGKNNWLFLTGDGYGDPIGDYMNLNLYSPNDLAKAAERFQLRANWIKQQGSQYLLVLVPEKHDIYPEQLPNYLKRQGNLSATQQLTSYLEAATNVDVINLTLTLLQAKEETSFPLYYATDTHWNDYGANIAQYTIAKKILELLPNAFNANFHSEDAFVETEISGGDLAQFLNQANILKDTAFILEQELCAINFEPENPIDALPFTSFCTSQSKSALIFRDSFFKALRPYISSYFKEVHYLTQKSNFESLQTRFRTHPPDIVIEEIAARHLPYLPSIDKNFLD